MPSFMDVFVNATFIIAAGVQVWQHWRQIQEELAERATTGSGGGGRGLGGGGSRPRRVVLVTPQGERLVVLASDEALQELGILQNEDARGGGEGTAARALGRGDGDFGPDDYEALSSLDEGLRPAAARAAPVSQELLDRLPTHEHRCRSNTSSSSGAAAAAAAAAAAPGAGSGGGDEHGNGGGETPCDTCSVCLQDFAGGETVRTLPCLHHFHPGCVDPWLRQRGRNLAACPVCKTRVFV